jgi:hypothetical protein
MLLDFLLHQLQVIQHVMYSSSKEDQLEYEGEEPPSWSSSVRGCSTSPNRDSCSTWCGARSTCGGANGEDCHTREASGFLSVRHIEPSVSARVFLGVKKSVVARNFI